MVSKHWFCMLKNPVYLDRASVMASVCLSAWFGVWVVRRGLVAFSKLSWALRFDLGSLGLRLS